MMHLGFSYVGLIYLIMLMVPNIIWAKNKPKDYEKYVRNENKVLLALERVGEVLVTVIVLIFRDFNLRRWTLWSLWLAASFVLMILYELYWHRYFKSGKTMKDQYSSYAGFPVAGATLPVAAFCLLGIYGINIWLIIAVVILGIGHIGIHLAHAREVYAADNEKAGEGDKIEKAASRRGARPLGLRILKWVGVVLLAVLFLALVIPIGARNVRFLKHQANYIHGVDEQLYIPIGGQEQYVLITGRDVTNPVIVYLHGGPAAPDTMVMYTFADELMKDYTLIGWDQRGAGRTYFRNQAADPENQTATFEQALEDVDELVDYARERFGQEKVIIMGHSYGTALGSRYVRMHPEKVSSYIGVGQVVSLREGDILSYQDALEKARAAGDDTSEMEKLYEAFAADPTLENMLALRQPVAAYHSAGKEPNNIWLGMSSPYFGMDDLKWFMLQVMSQEKFLSLNRQLFDSLGEIDAWTADARNAGFEMPVHIIMGGEDWICPVEPAREFVDEISAPQKDFTLIDGCGHSPQNAAPAEFDAAVRKVLEGEKSAGEPDFGQGQETILDFTNGMVLTNDVPEGYGLSKENISKELDEALREIGEINIVWATKRTALEATVCSK